MTEVVVDTSSAKPFREGENSPLNIEFVIDLLRHEEKHHLGSHLVPFRPKAGEIFLYIPALPTNKDDWRADGHAWINAGIRSQPKKNPQLKKSYFHLRNNEGKAEKGFRRDAYWLLDSKVGAY